MDVLGVMERRHATRVFDGEALTNGERDTVSRLIADAPHTDRTVTLDLSLAGETGFDENLDAVSYYGRFKDVPACVTLRTPASADGLRAAGCKGESLVLALVAHGFDTCWAGGAIVKADGTRVDADADGFADLVAAALPDAHFVIDIVFGHALREGHPHKSKPIAELLIGAGDGTAPAVESLPNWFVNGMRGVQLAPSALNKQTVRFAPGAGAFDVRVQCLPGLLTIVNSGVAMCHFELASGVPVDFDID
ncbi:MAG: nitroreductase family protein [Bifidobacterium sp.]|nr:nitroreductase family protein [Bifidobacterium sp.]